jgi:alpha-tubulin suppressor-like RCC1 family protein
MVISDGLFSTLATGSSHACGVLTNGTALCWGRWWWVACSPLCGGVLVSTRSLWLAAGVGSQGQLGTGASTASITPVAVSGGHTFAQIAAGSAHTCGLLANGSALCWGECSETTPLVRMQHS